MKATATTDGRRRRREQKEADKVMEDWRKARALDRARKGDEQRHQDGSYFKY
jgi:hypothetical protein